MGGTKSIGTTYLPLDHWAYPVVERAMGKGALPSQFLGQRPWTRTAIALLLVERHKDPQHYSSDDESLTLVHALEREFDPELRQYEGDRVRSAELEDVYTRVTGISGTPLRDTYHLGQTIVNDYGRAYGEGVSNVTGAVARATYDFLGFEGRGEYQHSPGIPSYGPSQLATLTTLDHLTTAPVLPDNGAQDNGTLLDTYAGMTWKRAYLSFGRESNWWGPGESSAMLSTDNVAPMYQLKFDVAEPITLPWIFKYLGPLRYQMYMAKLKGHFYPRQAYLHGEKVSLMPTQNLEIGFSRTTVAFGFGRPWTFKRLARTYFSVGDQPSSANALLDPGDRRGGFDLKYRVPGVRNWLSVYLDSFVDDDPSPLNAPNRAAFHPGFYLSHFPGLAKLDLRAEGAYTQLPTEPNYNGYFFYTNSNYRDGYTMQGLLIGDWVGREGKGGQVSSTYWLGPERTFQVYWRNHMIAPDFIPGGAHQNDFGTSVNYAMGAGVTVGANLQFEEYKIPFLAAGQQANVTAAFTLTFWPQRRGANLP